ncbi:MAG: sterol desaturase family protein, partial [Sphingomonas sp.]
MHATIATDGPWAGVGNAARYVGNVWINQLGGMFVSASSTLSFAALTVTLLLAALLAVPRGRRSMPRLRVWRRALFPRRLFASASGRADIAWFVFGLLFFGIAFSWAIWSADAIDAGVAAALRRTLGAAPLALPAPLNAAILTGAAFIAYEFAYWLDHRLSHASPLLWQFHRVHHAAESLSLLTNFRVHPVDTIVFYNIVAVMMGATGGALHWALGADAAAWTVGGTNALIMVSAVVLTHLQHSHLWVEFGPRWNRWLLSPAHHQIHHSADPADFDRNFGSTLAIWDRMFGTLRPPRR